MASIRFLKKDIDYLMSLVLQDCVFVMENHPEIDKGIIMGIAQQVIIKHHELRKQVNHPDGKNNRVLVKKYLRSVIENLYNAADKSLDQLLEAIGKDS